MNFINSEIEKYCLKYSSEESSIKIYLEKQIIKFNAKNDEWSLHGFTFKINCKF